MKKREISDINKFIRGLKYIGMGSSAYIYLTPNGEVLKVYKDDDRGLFYTTDIKLEETLEFLSDISNDSYLGPTSIVTSNDRIVGYTMPYAYGNTLMNLDVNVLLDEFCYQLEKLNEDTIDVTNKGFVMLDFHDENAIYSNEFGFKVIDLDGGARIKDKKNNFINFNKNAIKNLVISSLFKIPYGKSMYWIDPIDKDLFLCDEFELSDVLQTLSLKYLEKKNPSVEELVKVRSRIVYRKDIDNV